LSDAEQITETFYEDGEATTKAYTTSEIRLIIDGANGWLKVYFSLLFTTGMRVGEVLGLEWEHIDFENKIINLQ
jgi:integrase